MNSGLLDATVDRSRESELLAAIAERDAAKERVRQAELAWIAAQTAQSAALQPVVEPYLRPIGRWFRDRKADQGAPVFWQVTKYEAVRKYPSPGYSCPANGCAKGFLDGTTVVYLHSKPEFADRDSRYMERTHRSYSGPFFATFAIRYVLIDEFQEVPLGLYRHYTEHMTPYLVLPCGCERYVEGRAIHQWCATHRAAYQASMASVLAELDAEPSTGGWNG